MVGGICIYACVWPCPSRVSFDSGTPLDIQTPRKADTREINPARKTCMQRVAVVLADVTLDEEGRANCRSPPQGRIKRTEWPPVRSVGVRGVTVGLDVQPVKCLQGTCRTDRRAEVAITGMYTTKASTVRPGELPETITTNSVAGIYKLNVGACLQLAQLFSDPADDRTSCSSQVDLFS